jgi:hypothetical protein
MRKILVIASAGQHFSGFRVISGKSVKPMECPFVMYFVPTIESLEIKPLRALFFQLSRKFPRLSVMNYGIMAAMVKGKRDRR